MNYYKKLKKLLHKLKPNPCVCGCPEFIINTGKTSVPFYLPSHRHYCFLTCENCDGRHVLRYAMTSSGAVRKAVKEWNRRTAKKKSGEGK